MENRLRHLPSEIHLSKELSGYNALHVGKKKEVVYRSRKADDRNALGMVGRSCKRVVPIRVSRTCDS